MDISIVIVNYNTSRLLLECIKSIKKETKSKYEIIVVDNASSDQSCKKIRVEHPDVILIENKNNNGFARANNQGFERACGRYFMILNPDTVILNGAIDKLVEFMDQNRSVGICGPKNISADGSVQIDNNKFPSFWKSFSSYFNLEKKIRKLEIFRIKNKKQECLFDWWDVERVVGCAMVIRSQLYKKLNGFDEKYFMYFEETDFCYRAKKNGVNIAIIASAEIIHYGGESSKTRKDELMFDQTLYKYYFRSQYIFYEKNYGMLSMIIIRILDLCYGIILIAKNIFRIDKITREQKIAKGKAIFYSATATKREKNT